MAADLDLEGLFAEFDKVSARAEENARKADEAAAKYRECLAKLKAAEALQ